MVRLYTMAHSSISTLFLRQNILAMAETMARPIPRRPAYYTNSYAALHKTKSIDNHAHVIGTWYYYVKLPFWMQSMQ